MSADPLAAHPFESPAARAAEPAPPRHDPVRDATDAATNARIDRETEAAIAWYRSRPAQELDARIDELGREWDIERWLATNASVLILTGLALGLRRGRGWLALPTVVASFLLHHALRGWCPPIVLFRRFGVRTRQEIDRELYALRALRGDFDGLVEPRLGHRDASAGGSAGRPTHAPTPAASASVARPVLGGVAMQRRHTLE